MKILYVEDQKDIQMIAEMALVNIGGFEVKICSSGKEALDVVVDFLPDLFLLDVMMPDMNGPETLERLWKIPVLRDVPVIFMTAKVQTDEIDSYMSMGALGVIAKPFDPITLAENINALWHKK